VLFGSISTIESAMNLTSSTARWRSERVECRPPSRDQSDGGDDVVSGQKGRVAEFQQAENERRTKDDQPRERRVDARSRRHGYIH